MDIVLPDRPTGPARAVEHPDDVAVGFGGSPATVPMGQLRLSVVGGNRIDVAAIGALDAASFDHIASRLDRLTAGGTGCIHIDCSRVASIDPSVVELFVRARDRLQAIGATLELTDPPRELLLAMAPTAGKPLVAVPTPTALAS